MDSDLAELYQVETRALNQAVKRNIRRFPPEFMFQLTKKEFEDMNAEILISQIVISKENRGGRRKMPFVFTEQGVSMLAGILKSDIAIEISIRIINAFVQMRKFISTNAGIFQRLDKVEQKQLEADNKIDAILNAIQERNIKPRQGIFYAGQIFDAYTLIADIIRSAKKLIILIDNYIDDTVFMQLTKRIKNVTATIYTKAGNKIIKQDLAKHNAQYPKIELKELATSHDRFLIIDNKTVYHFGASLKDAGKKWFAFSKLNIDTHDIWDKL